MALSWSSAKGDVLVGCGKPLSLLLLTMRHFLSRTSITLFITLGTLYSLSGQPPLTAGGSSPHQGNLLVDISGELLNRLVGDDINKKDFVQDTILDVPVMGWFQTRARSQAVL